MSDYTAAGLRRTLDLKDLVLLIVGTVIGSGIFIVPSTVLRNVGGYPGPAIVVWVCGGILSLLGALTYGELSSVNPATGGLYVHIRDCFGRLPAFLFGWTLFAVISSGSVATLAVASTSYLGRIVPLGTWTTKVAIVSIIGLLAAINIRGTRESARLQNWLTLIKVSAIVVMAAALLWKGKGFGAVAGHWWPAGVPHSFFSGIGSATIAVLWAYEGWQYCTFTAGETRSAGRNFPVALCLGLSSLVLIYVAANLGYLSALGPTASTTSSSIAAGAVGILGRPLASQVMSFVILISMVSAMNSHILTAPRVYYAMAVDGLFFRHMANVHPRFATPALAIALTSIWSIILALTGTFEQLLTSVVFIGWIFYGLAAASIFIYRRRETGTTMHYRVPGYPWTPLVFILGAFVLVTNTIWARPGLALVAIGLCLLSLPVYAIWRGRATKQSNISFGGTAGHINALRPFRVSQVLDALGAGHAFETNIRPLDPKFRIIGRAVTVRCERDDNLSVIDALDQAEQGDVLVISSPEDSKAALWGELLTMVAKVKGVSGTIVDGAVRDISEICAMGYPVFARTNSPQKPQKRKSGSRNEVVSCGSLRVQAGDIVLADVDGIIAIPANSIGDVLTKILEVSLRESQLLESISKSADLSNVFKMLKKSADA